LSLERGVCSCVEMQSFLVTEAERKHVRRRARFQQHRYASCHEVFFFLQGKAPKGIYAILTETLGEHAPSYATVKNWVVKFKRGDFSTCDVPRPGRLKTVTTPKIIDKIHELILEDRRISATSIAEQLGISHERVGSIIHEVLDMRKLSAKWVPKYLNVDQKRQRCQSSEQLLEFRLQKSAGNVLASIFWDQDSILLIDYLPKGQTINAEYYSSLLVQLKDILKEKRRGKSPRGSCSCTTMPRLTEHLQPRRNWPTWASIVLIAHPILRMWPRWTTNSSLD